MTLPRSGVTLRGMRTSNDSGPVTLCLHGWLDNCSSFLPLFESMPARNLVAIDLPGHGHSDAIPSTTCQYLDYVACVLELAQHQGWNEFRLIGHSLGGALSTLIAGIFPERISQLVLIDAIGPLSAEPDECRTSAARYLSAYLNDNPSPTYRSRSQAVKARVQLADIVLDTADRLVDRDLRPVTGGFEWRSDNRLRYPFVRTFSEEQVRSYLRAISAPTLLVLARRSALTEDYYPYRINCVPDIRTVTLDGGHHLHMENTAAVATAMERFFEADERDHDRQHCSP